MNKWIDAKEQLPVSRRYINIRYRPKIEFSDMYEDAEMEGEGYCQINDERHYWVIGYGEISIDGLVTQWRPIRRNN